MSLVHSILKPAVRKVVKGSSLHREQSNRGNDDYNSRRFGLCLRAVSVLCHCDSAPGPDKAFYALFAAGHSGCGKGSPRSSEGAAHHRVSSYSYVGGIVLIGADALRHGCSFGQIFGLYLLFMYGYKVFDILVQDQYIFIKKKYFLRFFPETKDCKSWNNRSFNKSNQWKRLITFPFVCALMAWLITLVR